jgi:hypothetical protein
VFACKTCYIDQLKKQGHSVESNADYDRLVRVEGLVKPHGFCFGCMLTCHKSHDWFELKMRMNFRCDCGNGRMPHGCLLSTPELIEYDHENAENVYSNDFFDIFCYCQQLYTGEEPEDKFMIACSLCQEWYHYRHLEPQINEDSLLDDHFNLICRHCLQRNPIIWKKLQQQVGHYFHQSAKNGQEGEVPKKRIKTSENDEKSAHASCSEVEEAEKYQKPFDLLIN